MKNAFILLIISLSFYSCDKEKKQAEEDRQIIEDYIDENNLDAVEGSEGLFYVIETQGSGPNPNLSSTVTVNYKGYFTDGNVFDQSTSQGATFPLTGVIEGWQIGIPYFNEGGQGILLIPSALGYGPSGQGSIPGNAVLLFDIDLLDVQ